MFDSVQPVSKDDNKMGNGSRLDFPAFPYKPYDIQSQFMQRLYEVLENGGVGLMESPTGTGKTLSIICSALQWLEDKQRASATGKENEPGEALPAWMQEAHCGPPAQEAKRKEKTGHASVTTMGAKQISNHRETPRKKKPQVSEGDDPEEFLLDEGGSDAEETGLPGAKRPVRLSDSSSGDESDEGDVRDEPPPAKTQVLFCSRTHSQLTQFVGELRRTHFGSTLQVVALASRKALCINPDVQKLRSATGMNEKCLDLQKKKPLGKKAARTANGRKAKKSVSGCKYLKSRSKARQLKEAVLGEVMDVEELGKAGEVHGVCPYYASRTASPHADLLVLPHSALLAQETREALGLRLEGSVVIVDEAHNLVDAVAAAHSATLTARQLRVATSQLRGYMERFRTRLAPANLEQLEALVQVASSILASLREVGKEGHSSTAVLQHVNDYLFKHGLHDINMFRLVRFVKERKLLFKVSGYMEKTEGADDAALVSLNSQEPLDDDLDVHLGPGSQGSGPLQAFLCMLSALNNADKDGRLLMECSPPALRYILLNAASQFGKRQSEAASRFCVKVYIPVVAAAHAVILASGTLAPITSLQQQLFPELAPERLHHFSCGHVVPKERLLALALGKGPSGHTLDFRHSQRSKVATMTELGTLLVNVCQAVPGGVVVFFPSFGYADEVQEHWRCTGMMDRLAARKRIFREPRDATQVEADLREYASHIAKGTDGAPGGAVLLCVVGAKMSEGINFGNDLARCVVVVGLPYPNPEDPELQERMRFLDRQQAQTERSPPGSISAGREYYEDLCMKAVNQCVGRVIRHSNDWAAIVLADMRYTASGGASTPASPASNAVLRKLPAWVQDSLLITSGFGDAFGRLHRFCRSMKTEGPSTVRH